jgi:hypothetical protein
MELFNGTVDKTGNQAPSLQLPVKETVPPAFPTTPMLSPAALPYLVLMPWSLSSNSTPQIAKRNAAIAIWT